MRSVIAIRTRSASEVASILRMTWLLWICSVTSLIPSSEAACLLRSPPTTRGNTSFSRGVKRECLSFSCSSCARFLRIALSRTNAAWIAFRNRCGSTGFTKNSKAPPFIALTEDRTSALPLMKIMGGENFPDICCNKSKPPMSGRLKSRTRHADTSVLVKSRNCLADENVQTWKSHPSRNSRSVSRRM